MSKGKMEEVLEQKGRLVTAPLGTSMLPLIRPQKDVVILEKQQEPPKKYDVVLYKRDNGTYILHRVLGKDDTGYVLCGDNQAVKEYRIQEKQILAVLTSFYRGEKKIEMKSNRQRLYATVWCSSLTMRKLIFFGRRIINKLRREWKKIRERIRETREA